MMNTRCKVERLSYSGGKIDAPVLVDAGALFTPIEPITTELQQRFVLDTPARLFQSFTMCAEVQAGDTLTAPDGAKYSVSGVDDWQEHGSRSSSALGRYKVVALTRIEVQT
jgi:hypothetical protein